MAEGLGEGWSDEYSGVSRGLLSSVQDTSDAVADQFSGSLSAKALEADLSIHRAGNGESALLSELRALGDRIERMRIYLDSGRLVGGIAKDMDAAMGKIDARVVRTS